LNTKAVGTALLAVGSGACVAGSVAEIVVLASSRRVGSSIAGGVTLVVVLVVAALVLARAADHLEHRARGQAPIRRQDLAARGIAPRRGRFYRHSPATQLLHIGFLTIFGIVAIVAAFATRADGQRSTYTQDHGVAEQATVEVVHVEQHSSRYSSWDTYDYTVSLPTPVAGVATATVDDPAEVQSYFQGQSINVVVDPKEPRYAELPGNPNTSAGDWLYVLALACFFLLFAVVNTYEFYKRGGLHGRAATGLKS
jgi:hypothetical protein